MAHDNYPHGEELTDVDLQEEIELVGDLVVAASLSDGPLPQDEIDRILGVSALPRLRPGTSCSQAAGSTRHWGVLAC